MKIVGELMTRELVTLGEQEDLLRAEALLHQRRIRHLPVVHGKKLVGLITHRDLLRVCANRKGSAKAVLASEVMTREVATVTPDTPLHDVVPRMLAAQPEEPLRAALQQMESEHLLIDALLPTQLEAWARLEAQPALLPKLAAALAQGAALLDEALRTHLELEERVIIPALDRLLPRALQLQMVEEMKARRGVNPNVQG